MESAFGDQPAEEAALGPVGVDRSDQDGGSVAETVWRAMVGQKDDAVRGRNLQVLLYGDVLGFGGREFRLTHHDRSGDGHSAGLLDGRMDVTNPRTIRSSGSSKSRITAPSSVGVGP
jgi:uncharacterized Ntn-hydrolase superfamily protein